MEAGTNAYAALTHADISKNATIVEEGIKLCPLCRSEVKAFFINFNEKIIICENIECDYPFGYEEVIYFKEDNEKEPDDELTSLKSKKTYSSPSATYSMVSSTSWSDIEKMQKISDTEEPVDVRPERKMYFTRQQSKAKVKKKVDENTKIQKQLEDIKKLNAELIGRADNSPVPFIKNEKWIKNLMGMQRHSGVALIKPGEMKLINKQQPATGLGDLKIDIDVGSAYNMSSIKIEIGGAQTNKNISKKI